MADLRDMTHDEAERQRHRSHERRDAECHQCPYCDALSGVSSGTPDPAVLRCHDCGRSVALADSETVLRSRRTRIGRISRVTSSPVSIAMF